MRRLVLSLSIGALAAQLSGCGDGFRTVGFAARVDTPLGNNRSAVTLGLGDLDGDGRLDAVVTNSQNEVNVLISQGDGRFATGVAYPAEMINNGAPRSLAVGDLSGDGRPDVVVGNVQQGNVSLYLNLGDGRLQAVGGNPLSVNCQPVAMALYDLNRDGSSDVVIACNNPSEVHVLKNRGQAGQIALDAPYVLTYEQTVGMSQVPDPRSLAVGDLDGNGDGDVVVGTDNDVRILNNPKEGPRANYTVSVPLAMRPGGVAIADVNGNGVADVAALVSSQEVRAFEYAKGGTFGQLVAYQNLGTSGRGTIQGLGVGDFLKTGRSDFVVALPNPSEVRLVVNRGEVNAVAQPVTASYQYRNGLNLSDNGFAVGDVTGDGLPDVVLRNGSMVSALVNASLY